MKNLLGVADYGMNVWYGGAFNLEQRLDLLKSCKIDGIEWLKASSMSEAMQNAILFHRKGMDFASCDMGNPELSMKCASAFGKEYVWFTMPCGRDVDFDEYCRRANAFTRAAKYYNIKAAIHNHLGNRVQDEAEIVEFMERVPDAFLLLDIAHLHAAGGDNVAMVNKFADRLAAVHFKDIFYKDLSIGFDRWWDRLRFCELGGGNAGLDYEEIARALVDNHYSKWVLIEHDTHLREPEIDLKISADILRELFK